MSQVRAENHYRVIGRVATGGMAEVFHAESVGIAGFTKSVAIKRVLPHLASNEKFIQMFLDEARLSARLDHRNIVQVFDVGCVGDAYFIVMEYVDGVTLKALVDHLRKRGESIPVPVAVQIVVEICNGLHYAHRLKDSSGRRLDVVHRDVSPANVLLSRNGGVKIMDFGLAKAASQLEKTDPGVLKGKFGYLSPETAQGAEADAFADQFATGIVLWEMLAGRRLFQGETDFQTVQKVRDAQVPSLPSVNPEVPPALDAVLRKALAKDKTERYANMGALSRALTEFLFANGQPVASEDIAILVHEVLDVRFTAQSGVIPPRQSAADRAQLEQQLKGFQPIAGAPLTVPPPEGLPEAGARRGAGAGDDSAPIPLTRAGDSNASTAGVAKAVPEPAPRKRSATGVVFGLLAVCAIVAGGAYAAGLVPGLRPPRGARPAQDEQATPPAQATTAAAPTQAQAQTDAAAAQGDAGAATGGAAADTGPLPDEPSWRSRTQMHDAIEARVRACESAQSEHYGRHARLFATYDGATGHALDVHFNGNYFDDKPIGPCILAAVRDVPAPRFQRPRWDTDYEFLLH